MMLPQLINPTQSKPLPFRGGVGGGACPQTPRQSNSPNYNPAPKAEGLKHLIILGMALMATPLSAQQDGPPPPLANEQLSDPRQEARATDLMETLRCIQCQGQSIADSDAPMAGAMRAEVRQRIAKGEKPESVRDLMISRYGEWVSFEPAMRGSSLLLWAAPLLILLVAAWFARGLFQKPKP